MFKPKKLILSIFTLGLTAITLTSTTYAWFSRNNEAWTDDFKLNIENTTNLLVSTDGKSYKTFISQDEIKKLIVKNKLGTIDNLTDEKINSEYDKIKLSTVFANKKLEFSTIDSKNHDSDNCYLTKTADIYSYISFDLYFRIDNTQEIAEDEYELKLADSAYSQAHSVRATEIKGLETTVKLHNCLTALDILGNPTRYGPLEKTEEYDRTSITINPTNAIRLGFYNEAMGVNIYEPYIGYGSYAIEEKSGTNSIYDPLASPMYTYFKNIYEYKLKALREEDVPETHKSFSEGAIAKFVKSEDGLTYNDVKITTYIWLEGYDADYIPGIDVSSISSYLCFYKAGGNK